MKYIIFVLSLIISVSSFAQNDIPVKTDGTKYYIQIYDGDTNEKVLYHDSSHSDWKTKVRVADYFDGSKNQLWSFEATEEYPGYFSIVNYDKELTLQHHLMSWNWNAYFTDNRDPSTDLEMQFRAVKAYDGYFIIETIEKPAGLYGVDYTPGADALNVKPEGYASFSDVKSADITPDNMENKVFKLVEFDPMSLFISAIERSQELYDANPNAPEALRYDLFYIMEKARETRVFGTEAEMLAFQPKLDSVVNNFNEGIDLFNVVTDAKTFIEGSDAGADVKDSFTTIVNDIEAHLNSEDLNYDLIDEYRAKLLSAQNLVEAIVAAETYDDETLQGLDDQRLSSGMMLTIDAGKSVLADLENGVDAFEGAVVLFQKKTELIDEIIIAQELIEETQDFEEAKQVLDESMEEAITMANDSEATAEELEAQIGILQDAIKVFREAIEGGSLVAIENGGFEDEFHRWNSVTNVSLPYTADKGVDGSKNMTVWSGSDYQFMTSQSIESIPNGTYEVSVMAEVNGDNSIALFAESGESVSELPLLDGGGLTKRSLEIEVADGMLQFGIRGTGENNGIPGGNWGRFDNFEIKWMSEFQVPNYDFENDLANWTVDANPAGTAYISNKGVNGSKSVTCWSGTEYSVGVFQALTGLSNGVYTVTAMTNSNRDGSFVVYGSSGSEEGTEDVISTGALAETTTTLQVNDGTLEFGIKGSGENNSVPAGHWIVFDNVEVKIDTIAPGYVEVAGVPQFRTEKPDMLTDQNEVRIWQNAGNLYVRSSSKSIVGYSVYSITGALLKNQKMSSQFLTIPLGKGIFVIKVVTEDGSVNNKKIVIQ